MDTDTAFRGRRCPLSCRSHVVEPQGAEHTVLEKGLLGTQSKSLPHPTVPPESLLKGKGHLAGSPPQGGTELGFVGLNCNGSRVGGIEKPQRTGHALSPHHSIPQCGVWGEEGGPTEGGRVGDQKTILPARLV